MVLNSETFQEVEETGDMAQKTGDNLLPKHQLSTKKEERIVTATIHFLSSESYIRSLLYIGCFGSQII